MTHPDLLRIHLATIVPVHFAGLAVHCSDTQPALAPVDFVVAKALSVVVVVAAAAPGAVSASSPSTFSAPLVHSAQHRVPYQSVAEWAEFPFPTLAQCDTN
jgi:hypothetical protein